MFAALQPLLAERGIHILLSAASDGRIGVFVEPVRKSDTEPAAFSTPFRCEATAEELDRDLPGVLSQWIASRKQTTVTLTEALAAAEAETKKAAEEAKKKVAEKNKTRTAATGATTKTVAKAPPPAPVMPSLLDAPAATGTESTASGNTEHEEESGCPTDGDATIQPEAASAPAESAPAPQPAAPTAESPAPAPATTTVVPAGTTPELFY